MTGRSLQAFVAGIGGAGALLASGFAAPVASASQYNVFYSDGVGCGLFSASATPGWSESVCGGQSLEITTPLGVESLPDGSEENISTAAPAGVAITEATTNFAVNGNVGGNGWGSGDFYDGGGNSWNPNAATSPFSDPPMTSSRWGFQLLCSSGTGCSTAIENGGVFQSDVPAISVSSVAFTATETQAPSLTAPGAANLFGQTSSYAWNPPGDPWSLVAAGSDPSGTCNISAVIAGSAVTVENQDKNQYAWQQCVNGSWSVPVDTRQYVKADGSLPITLQATNAAGNTSSANATIKVDNDPVTDTLSTPNDPNPTLWVNHAVTVASSATAGPSGISGITCAVDGGASSAYPGGGVSVDGDGTHTVSCTASNNAVDPQGEHNTGTANQAVKIDEAPPAVGFEPVNPADPTALTVDASDAESGVAGGSITVQGPHAKAPRALKTTFDGAHLLSRFDDAGKHGLYTFVANACDQVGNCASTTEALHFPIRLGSRSYISFLAIEPPAKVVRARVRVGYRTRTVVRRRHGRRVRKTIKLGGHFRRVKVHVNANTGCGVTRVKVRRRDYQEVRVCRRLTPRVVTHHRQHLGRKVSVHGLVTTKQGRPLANVRVALSTKLSDRGGRFRRVLVTRTDKHGVWSAKLSGGPSRTIRARYLGSRVVEPATSLATLTVPAQIRLHISPHVLPWSHRIHIRGHLVGRYVPHDGVALRLLVRYSKHGAPTPLQALRTTRHGAFSFSWTFHAGHGVATYPFTVATTATESDYPYASGSSRRVAITFGRRTPHHRHAHHGHHKHHRGG